MLEAGDDPLFVSRRMLIFASEDVGNADARGLLVASAADATLRRVGMPEGLYALAQACTYLATAPKSNASTLAFTRARALIEEHGALPVPMKLRNAVTPLMKGEGQRHGLQVRARLRGRCRPRRNVPARSARGLFALRANRAGRGVAHQGATGEAAGDEREGVSRQPSAPIALPSSDAACASPFLRAASSPLHIQSRASSSRLSFSSICPHIRYIAT